MTVSRLLLGAALLLAPPLVPSSAYQPTVLEPGGTYAHVLQVTAAREGLHSRSARVRLRGHRFFSSPRQAAVRGEWVDIPEVFVHSEEYLEIPVVLPVPPQAPPVLGVEIDGQRDLLWTYAVPPTRGALHVEASSVVPERHRPGRESLPFRLMAGGEARYEFDDGTVRAEAASTTMDWDALREDFGFLAPESWNLLPADPGPDNPIPGYRPASFCSAIPPDLETETVIGIRTPAHDVLTAPRHLWVRSVDRLADGTVVCRFSYRYRRIPEGNNAILLFVERGAYILVAIPKTDGPVVFRRVP